MRCCELAVQQCRARYGVDLNSVVAALAECGVPAYIGPVQEDTGIFAGSFVDDDGRERHIAVGAPGLFAAPEEFGVICDVHCNAMHNMATLRTTDPERLAAAIATVVRRDLVA
jgi:hypothetical protein